MKREMRRKMVMVLRKVVMVLRKMVMVLRKMVMVMTMMKRKIHSQETTVSALSKQA